MTAQNVEVSGPVIDDETGMRAYTVRAGGDEVEFGIVPIDEGGVTLWLVRPGASMAFPNDPGVEPYDTPEDAYEAGMRASRAALGV
ncbi:MAG TPA: hypothetical protein VFB58_10260 [Chloroflexota bacterium]|nr:hypothetical protein [Chloroflexota bacterium]